MSLLEAAKAVEEALVGPSVSEALLRAANQMYREGHKPNNAFISPADWARLAADGPCTPVQSTGHTVAFKVIRLLFVGGHLNVFADLLITPGQAYLMDDTKPRPGLGQTNSMKVVF